MIFSHTAIIVDRAAKDMNKKKRDAQILPPVIFEKIFGSVMNNNDGPCPTETPYEKGIYHGKIVLPSDYPMSPPDIYFFTVLECCVFHL